MAYWVNTEEQQREMLAALGLNSVDELFEVIPPAARLKGLPQVPPALTEQELTEHLNDLASRNRVGKQAVCFLGGGSYDHFIPAVVDAVASRSEFYTAYTPYQAEASQGSLQVFFEYQTLICQLTGMEVANASLYEGASALAEAAMMALSVTGRYGRVIVAESVHPHYRQTLRAYLANLEPQVITLSTPHGFLEPDALDQALTDDTAAVLVQHPNFFGHLEEVEELAARTHRRGALFVVSVDPISLGLLRRPGEYDADIVVAEGQSLGIPMQFGGPYLGVLACREAYVRKMPGRLVGQTVDRRGQRCWVLTLQTREQHIRREKATSNICTNQGLMAIRAAVYLAALGPQGLRETAELCLQKAHYAAQQLCQIPGVRLAFDRPFFKEFTVLLPTDPPPVLRRVLERGYLGGLALRRWYPQLANAVSLAVTEKRSRGEIDGLVAEYRQALAQYNRL
ncbi:MAG: aminomethyl-transferring glycine dehydrogenase subunit GcvPA [Gemmatales bacterium]|nr:aminomethyl-transferring glycine dehydrogenase subunit GcvPA [Gemmatales bacterium]MDW7995553.1 aminomethyl-transferring glycine dehydrogenase subunit GcvPA [Gemmatales bacterium]